MPNTACPVYEWRRGGQKSPVLSYGDAQPAYTDQKTLLKTKERPSMRAPPDLFSLRQMSACHQSTTSETATHRKSPLSLSMVRRFVPGTAKPLGMTSCQ